MSPAMICRLLAKKWSSRKHNPRGQLPLESRVVSPVCSQLRTSWVVASDRTKRYYTQKAGQAVAAMVHDISPSESVPLFHEVISSDALRHQLTSDDDSTDDECEDETLMLALAECYDAANS